MSEDVALAIVLALTLFVVFMLLGVFDDDRTDL